MKKDTPAKLAYDLAYQKRPGQVKKREERNTARAAALKAGTVKKGDGKDVDHVVPLGSGGSNDKSNRRVISETKNRGWRGGESGYKPKKA
jgi:hypothetical protein